MGDKFTYDGVRYVISSTGKVRVGDGTSSSIVTPPAGGTLVIPESGVVSRMEGGQRYKYNVTGIAANAFAGSSIKSVELPSTVASIDARAFDGAVALESIGVSTDNSTYRSDGGVLYTKNGGILLRWPEGKRGRALIGFSYSLGDRAFADTKVGSFIQGSCVHSLGGSSDSVFAGVDRADAKVWVDTKYDSCTLETVRSTWAGWGFVRGNVNAYPSWKADLNYTGAIAQRPSSTPPGWQLTKPADPTRTGYLFGGWYKEAGCTTAWDFANDVMPEGDLTLYAKWTPVWYNVRYNLDGGEGALPPTQGVSYDQEFTILPCQGYLGDGTPWGISRTGYSFGGWRTVPAADATPDNPGAVYGEHEIVKNLASVNNAVVDLYAVWKPNSYTVRFSGNTATSGSSPADIAATYDATVTMPANPFAKKGYRFQEWNTKQDGTGTTYAAGQVVEKANLTDVSGGSVTLYAVWKPIKYTVRYDLDGGSGTRPWDQTPAYDQLFNVRPAASGSDWGAHRTGYTFAGWRTVPSSDYSPQNPGTTYSANQQVKNLAENEGDVVTLYAVWAPIISVKAPLTAAVTVSAQGATVPADVTFSSTSVVPVKVASAACETVAGADGTQKTFPTASQWPSIALALKAGGSTTRLPLASPGSAAVALSGLVVPAASGGAPGKLEAKLDLELPSAVDIAYVPAGQAKPFAAVTYTFEVPE